MTSPIHSSAVRTAPLVADSVTAAGAILTRARRFFSTPTGHTHPGFRTTNRANTRALRGRGQFRAAQADNHYAAQALEAVADAEPVKAGSAPDASPILIAKVLAGLPRRLGNTARAFFLPGARHPSCSFERRPTHNTCGQRSERNEIVLVGLLDHPSFLSPGHPVVVTFGVRTSEHESKEFPDDGNLTAQPRNLTARGGNAKG